MANTYKMRQYNENEIRICGNVGKDPEWRDVGGGMLSFGVATKKSWKDKDSGEWKEKTTWHNVSMFGKQAQNLRGKISKGDVVRVVGEMESNKKGDVTYWNISPSFGGVKIVASKADGAGNFSGPDNNDGQSHEDDDLPF